LSNTKKYHRHVWRTIAEVKQRWSVIECVTKNLISPTRPYFGRHVKPLVATAFAVVSINPHWARVVGYGLFLCVIRKEGLYLSSGDINRLMKKYHKTLFYRTNSNYGYFNILMLVKLTIRILYLQHRLLFSPSGYGIR
jgi:hypothetical protein